MDYSLEAVICIFLAVFMYFLSKTNGVQILSAKVLGCGDYKVLSIETKIGANSFKLELMNTENGKVRVFNVYADDAGYIKIEVINPGVEGFPVYNLDLMIGTTFSVISTEENKGRGFAFAVM